LDSTIQRFFKENRTGEIYLNQTLKIGDFVRLIKSNNPYVPIGSILKIESISIKPDGFSVSMVKREWSKYFVSADTIRKVRDLKTPEKVQFT